MNGPISEEIHKHRAEHEREFNFDLAGICRDLKERSSNLKTARLPAKRIRPERENRVRP